MCRRGVRRPTTPLLLEETVAILDHLPTPRTLMQTTAHLAFTFGLASIQRYISGMSARHEPARLGAGPTLETAINQGNTYPCPGECRLRDPLSQLSRREPRLKIDVSSASPRPSLAAPQSERDRSPCAVWPLHRLFPDPLHPHQQSRDAAGITTPSVRVPAIFCDRVAPHTSRS